MTFRTPFAVISLLSTLSCSGVTTPEGDGSDELYVDETRTAGSYLLGINDIAAGSLGTEYSRTLIGETVDTNWSESIGTIYLGTDENNEPVGTLTLSIGSILECSDSYRAPVDQAFLSITDVREGTPAELNGHTFSYSGEEEVCEDFSLSYVKLGTNIIQAKIGALDM
jgi:hypothetical protein